MRKEAMQTEVASGHHYLARRLGMLLALVAMALLISSNPAFATLLTGTDGNDKLVGTEKRDRITGGAGNDVTKGRGGNDVYRYSDGWGEDVLYDTGGIDTLDFRGTTANVRATLCSELNGQPYGGEAEAREGEEGEPVSRVVFDTDVDADLTKDSDIENVRGGAGNDYIIGCSLSNRIAGGRGGNTLIDVGGRTDWGIPASNDTYVISRTSNNDVYDAGGESDVVRMTFLTSDQVRIEKADYDEDGVANSVMVTYDDPTTEQAYRIILVGHFGEDDYGDSSADRRIESLVFKDKTIDPSTVEIGEAPAAAAQKASSSLSEAMTEGSGS